MYATVWVNSKEVMTMVDTRATNNFVSRYVADQLGFVLINNSTSLNVVNLDGIPIHDLAVSELKVGTLQKELNFMVVPFDDFNLVLGIEFLGLAKVFIVPHFKKILIRDEKKPCFVHGV
ncbi:Aspartic peptidase domain containing protein [Parasponia andersonii]|uniref:Aspartic peptidase domain containing protein n=1 Tax=Parasponia andersonii TaxID=3476 RepID=A0A2P5AF34_PARAD|nr:Aspartic peptidase domain containing protein [Parasponia andersonii]